MFELSKQFRFDAAHALENTVGGETNRRIHGHSYRAEVTVRGEADATSGMLLDIGTFEKILDEAKQSLDHHFLNEIEGLGPATMENLGAWLWRRLSPRIVNLAQITVYRDSAGERCVYYGPDKK